MACSGFSAPVQTILNSFKLLGTACLHTHLDIRAFAPFKHSWCPPRRHMYSDAVAPFKCSMAVMS